MAAEDYFLGGILVEVWGYSGRIGIVKILSLFLEVGS